MGGLLTLAFAAGMVAPVNPCGFALLPAWITHTLGDTDASTVPVRLLREPGLATLATAVVAAAGYALLAVLLFNLGLRRYRRGASPGMG